MTLQPLPLRFVSDESLGTLASLECRQALYLRHYLADLGSTSSIEEPIYFDRDFLAEYAAYYSASIHSHSNYCQRLHFFAGDVVTRRTLKAAAGSTAKRNALQARYLGFVVVRPLKDAPLGRTVLAWYKNQNSNTLVQRGELKGHRVSEPSRDYKCHLAGVELVVRGLAWQQQDSAVGACATVALWSMLHSSAFDEHHAIPTTAQVTRLAHSRGSYGNRVFPSGGLLKQQVVDAIQGCELEPMVFRGDLPRQGSDPRFSLDRFLRIYAVLVRSGYPVLLGAPRVSGQHHAVCGVGFREASTLSVKPGELSFQDCAIRHLYIHDDNLGPNARFELSIEEEESVQSDGALSLEGTEVHRHVRLKLSPPDSRHSLPIPPVDIEGFAEFIPTNLIAAIHGDIRISIEGLLKRGDSIARTLLAYLNPDDSAPVYGFGVSARFLRLAKYMGTTLESTLRSSPARLAKVRLALAENVGPMSLFVGVVRLTWNGIPAFDILFDTTLGDRCIAAFCTVVYKPAWVVAPETLRDAGLDVGFIVSA